MKIERPLSEGRYGDSEIVYVKECGRVLLSVSFFVG